MKLYVGIDVSKRFHVAYAVGAITGPQKAFTFSHSEQGFLALRKWLDEIAPGQTPIFGVEPTEPFSGALAAWLRLRGLECHIIPGVYTKRAKYFYTQGGTKNDAIDAQVIAQLLRDGRYKQHIPQAEAAAELRELGQQYLRIAQLRRSTMQRIHNLIDHVWPEFTRHLRLQTKTAQALLERFDGPDPIVAMGLPAFERLVWELSQGQVKCAAALYQSAVESVGQPRHTVTIELRQQMALFRLCEANYAELTEGISAWLKLVDYAPLLMTIPGFGPLLVGLLIGQAGDLRNYPTARHLYKIAGLNLTEQSSGQYNSPVHISRSGSRALRRCLFAAAIGQCGGGRGLKGIYRPWYLERKAKGEPFAKTVIAVSRKLLRVAHAVARDGMPFEPHRFLADAR